MEKEMTNRQPEPNALSRPPVQWKISMVQDEKLSLTVIFPDAERAVPELEKQPAVVGE